MDLPAKLRSVRRDTLRATLTRAVSNRALFPKGAPANPNYLYTSGKPNRYNLDGTECFYAAMEEATALAEYRRQFIGLPSASRQPVSLYSAKVDLVTVLDLTDATIREALGLTLGELEANWGAALPPSRSQELGDAVARHGGIMAIRYRSVAMRLNGQDGSNVVIFKAAVRGPSYVEILSDTKEPLARWP